MCKNPDTRSTDYCDVFVILIFVLKKTVQYKYLNANEGMIDIFFVGSYNQR